MQAQKVIAEIARRISEQFAPKSVILFGSYARGTATADSDADLLVVMDIRGSRRRKATEIDLALAGIPIPTDVIVVTPRDVEKYRYCAGNIICEALSEGKLLYESAA